MAIGNRYCVVMFELNRAGEQLPPPSQVNEVFGPFDSEEAVEEWTERAIEIIKDRSWLIIPMSEPMVLNAIDPLVN